MVKDLTLQKPPVEPALVLPPLLADKVRTMLDPKTSFHVKQNIRNTLDLIRDELVKAIAKADRDLIR